MKPIGPERLGAFAREQLAGAHRDPRPSSEATNLRTEFLAALEEAERVREMATWGLFELRGSLEREEQRLGVDRHSPMLTGSQADALQAAWERAELARLEIDNEHPHLHAMALLSMHSALDALVEDVVAASGDRSVGSGISRYRDLRRHNRLADER